MLFFLTICSLLQQKMFIHNRTSTVGMIQWIKIHDICQTSHGLI